MPTATDLVTDLPADFQVFGQAVATSMADLLGGTTGQILSKTTSADMDFTWINNDQGDITGVTAGTGISGGGTSGTVTVTNSMATAIDAKGDLIGGTGADTFARLAVGTNGTVLTADSAETTGMKWATPAGGLTLIRSQSFTSASSVDLSDIFSTTYDNYLILGNYQPSAGADLRYRYRVSGADNSTTNYNHQAFVADGTSLTASRSTGQTLGTFQTGASDGRSTFSAQFFNPFLAQTTSVLTTGTVRTSSTMYRVDIFGGFNDTTSFTGLTLTTSTGTATGTVRIYGIANA